MLIREYTERDLDALRAIHAVQGFDYALPDLRNPLFVTKLVLSDVNVAPAFRGVCGPARPDSPASSIADTGKTNAPLKSGVTQDAIPAVSENSVSVREGKPRVVGAVLLRLTAEAYLLLDPRAGTPRERWQWLLALHEAARRDAWQRGLEDVHAWLPPPIAQKFGRRLERLGWRRDDAWTPYCIPLNID